MVGLDGLEPSTSVLSGPRSNRLSYRPAEEGWRLDYNNWLCRYQGRGNAGIAPAPESDLPPEGAASALLRQQAFVEGLWFEDLRQGVTDELEDAGVSIVAAVGLD